MVAFIYRMPGGIAGDISRMEWSKVEPHPMNGTTPVTVFGVPVQEVTGTIEPCSTGAVPMGFLVRPYPTQYTTSEALGTATPDKTKPANVMVSGYMTVLNTAGTPTAGGAVYYNNTTGYVEAYTGGSQTAVSGCHFMGVADADGNVEIGYNI